MRSEALRACWVYPVLLVLVALDWLIIKLPAKRWAKRRPGSQT